MDVNAWIAAVALSAGAGFVGGWVYRRALEDRSLRLRVIAALLLVFGFGLGLNLGSYLVPAISSFAIFWCIGYWGMISRASRGSDEQLQQ
ncbi:hypothetical protein SAMN05428996_2852 [Quadrisphaera sp. DSM 44207]|nr:hypothetical protein SAMN05428996_2852 [Quadrisphaera sp. DSM 44207]